MLYRGNCCLNLCPRNMLNANVFDLAIWCFSGFSAYSRLLCCTYWKRTTKHGVIASIVAAVITWLYYFHLSGYGGEYMVGPELFSSNLFRCFSSCFGCVHFLPAPIRSNPRKFFPNRVNCELLKLRFTDLSHV